MKSITKILSKFISLALAFSIIISIPISAEAKNYITSSSSAKGSNYTDNSKLASKLNTVFSGSIGLYSNSACTKSVSVPLGSRKMTGSNQYWIKSNTTGNKNSGWQCYIYADAVYNTLFNEWVGHGTSLSHSKKVMSGGSSSVSYSSLKNAGVKTGAIMRTTGNSNGSWNSSKGHSLIILSYDSSSITYLEGNGDGKGLVRIANLSWKEFNAGQLSGRSRCVCFIIQPTDSYYESLYPSQTETPDIVLDKSSVDLGLYSGTSATVTATIKGEWSNVTWSASSKYYNVSKSSQSGNKLTFKITAKAAGSDKFTLTSYNDGKVMKSTSINVNIEGAKFSSTASSVNLDVSTTNSKTITLSAGGNLPSKVYISWSYPESICSISAGEWSGTSIPLTLNGKAAGSGNITFYLKNYDNDATIATKTVSLSVSAPTYSIKYDANGGESTPSVQTKLFGKDLTLSSDTPTGKSYTVTFDGNGGTVYTDSQEYRQSFSHWNTQKDDSGTDYYRGGVYSSNASATLYAQWNDPTLYAKNPTRENYYFLGWYDSKEVNEYGKPLGKKYTTGTPITKDIILYAMWTTNLDLTVYFGDYDLNGNIDFINDVVAVNNIANDSIKYTDEDVFRCDVNADGKITSDDVTLINNVRTGKTNMYSMPAYLYFKNFSIKQAPDKIVYDYGEDFDCSGLVLQANYTNGTTNTISSGYVISGYDPYKIGEQTLKVDYYICSTYLKVTVKAPKFTIYYDANGGTIGSNGKTVLYGNQIGELPTPSRDGYTFVGWSYDINGTNIITEDTVYDNLKDKTIYAQWKVNSYTVTFNANGGSGAPQQQNVTYPSNLTISENVIPSRTGYSFLGYSANSTSKIPTYIPGDIISVNDDLTLYAVWEEAQKLENDYALNCDIDYIGQIKIIKFVPDENGKYRFYSDSDINLSCSISEGQNIISDFEDNGDFSLTCDLIKNKTYYLSITSSDIGNFDVYAEWLPKEYSIDLYDPISQQSASITALETDTNITLPVYENDGYTFLGWKKVDGDGTVFSIIENIDSDISLEVVWESNTLLGDVNGDGIVDAADAGLISRYDAGFIILTSEQLQVGDVNNDGVVDAGDAGIISRYDAGLITKIN